MQINISEDILSYYSWYLCAPFPFAEYTARKKDG